MTPSLQTKPIRTVLRWQVIATAVIAAIAGFLSGSDGVVSAVLGGMVNVAALASASRWCWGSLGTARSAAVGTSLIACSAPKPCKILLIVAGLWLVLSTYKDVVMAAFFAAFVVTVIVFSMAIFVRD